MKRSVISEPINIVTGALGAGKTLFAIQQADLLRRAGDAKQVYQVGINKPDLRKLPDLPFPLEEWADRADAGELEDCVIIVDEFHKYAPQRAQNSRPPKWIEEMAEARKRDVRFILLTQSNEFDHFLKGTRLNRHFYIARKSGMGRSTVFEWTARFVGNPEENKDARAAAIRFTWKHPVRDYGDWYESAKAHRFRIRLPFRAYLAIAFVPVAGFIIWRALSGMGDLIGGSLGGDALASAGPVAGQSGTVVREEKSGSVRTDDLETYLKEFNPLHPTLRWSAPAFQGREVRSDPQLFCSKGGEGIDANGEWQGATCTCFTEQMTRVAVDLFQCDTIVREGLYNPFKAPPVSTGRGGEPDGKGSLTPRPAAAAPPPPVAGAGAAGLPPSYGAMRDVSGSD